MRRRPQADGLWAKRDGPIIFIMRDVLQGDEDRHRLSNSSSFFEQNTGSHMDQALTTGSDAQAECGFIKLVPDAVLRIAPFDDKALATLIRGRLRDAAARYAT